MKTILQPGVNCSGIYDTGATGLLIDACDYYRAFYHAARTAQRYILIAGWQFDSEVQLLRGQEAREAGEDVRLLPFLEALCTKNEELEIFILAWDFSVIFSLEREWFQRWIFNWTTNKRIRFRFDNRHAIGATHHQKFVVIDGALAFVGGIDICSDRWDDRRHLLENRERVNSDGGGYDPYHDIQSYHTGRVAVELAEFFRERWHNSGVNRLHIPPVPRTTEIPFAPSISLPASRVALSRTVARHLQTTQEPVLEIRRLFVDAIMAAKRLIYLENQYFSSLAVYWALVARMTDPHRPRLQIVILLPGKLPFKDGLWLGVSQMKMVHALQRIAGKTGHQLGIYCTACQKEGEQRMVFIHSKLLIVDDRFLTVGSANTTNRSMGLDTELNVSWEAAGGELGVVRSIRRVRGSLLAEHTGVHALKVRRQLMRVRGLVDLLEQLTIDPATRICRYIPEAPIENGALLDAIEPIAGIADPEKPFMEELVFEYISENETSIFARGILLLGQLITGI
ncbi:phospholipase D-like domain-containing protein [Geobacter sp. DSM 9736]|uniref:phospholipase D-like domain-containing protein n=1 Tax=Geobacter sp. DSM 9736 TaxID=1277350 RepID=UPI000B504271|nr:phospholipase D-like domain-containing protein [Geobacter sp. DSM 9736]SNB46307.1 Phosphatidylserine/phosphatidylglycerophosphate/cardiolipin synthase [Geobacter sp. DSM 9736]